MRRSAERRDEGGQHDQPASTISFGHFGHAADVLHAIGVGEPQVLVQAVAHVVAVEQVGVPAQRVQRFSTRLAIVDLPAPDRPVNHSTQGRCPFSAARAGATSSVLPVDVVRAAQREVQHARADGVVAERSIRMKPPVSRLSV
jgi:hypothetical protein